MVDESKPRFESPHALRMFPTFVWRAELEQSIHTRINREIVAELAELRSSESVLKPGESWQSSHALHQRKAFAEIMSCIDEAAATVLDYLKIAHDGFETTACWATANAPGAGHKLHSHPNNALSGVYYVKTRAGADTINFHDPRPQTGIIRPPVTELTAENSDQVVVTVSDGTLLIFPSWLQHSVDPNRSSGERLSISFNIMFSAYTERMSQPLWGDRRES